MDIPIKLKACEKAALSHLNKIAPELYKEKNPGFRWAASMAAQRDNVEWVKISRLRIEDLISAKEFEDDDKSISHLTIEDQDFETLRTTMNEYFGMSKGVQKAFLARTIIKWGMSELNRESRLSAYSKLITESQNKLSDADALKIFADLILDDVEVDQFKKKTKEELISLLTRYRDEINKRGGTK